MIGGLPLPQGAEGRRGHRRGHDRHSATSEKLNKTDIPFWNRTTGPEYAKFRQLCDQGVGELKREHKAGVPPATDQ